MIVIQFWLALIILPQRRRLENIYGRALGGCTWLFQIFETKLFKTILT